MDAGGGKGGEHFPQLGGEGVVNPQHLGGTEAVREQVPEDLGVHGAAFAQKGGFPCDGVDILVFRGDCGACHPFALLILDEKVGEKQGGIGHQVVVGAEDTLSF